MNFHSLKKKINDTYAEIDLRILKKNFDAVKKHANLGAKQPIQICAIVKANAYGHGMNEVGKALSEHGADYLGTADYHESIILSDHLKKFSKKNTPVLCLGNLTEKDISNGEVFSRNIIATLVDVDTAKLLDSYAKSKNKKIDVHLQVDTGINRIGILLKDAYESVNRISGLTNLNIRGIYSHFATSEIPSHAYAQKQLKNFKSLIKELEQNVMKFEIRHICNSGGILNYNDHFFNMVRPGISLYGYYPDRKKVLKDIGIQPVMTLRSKVKFIKELDKRQSISYGRKYFTQKKTRIASVPVGYGDGYSRLLTNKSSVLINGKAYKTVGTVCMDWIMAELGNDHTVKNDDNVILFGKEYPADKLSDMIGTIPYEITCNVSSRVQRVYTE